VLVKRLIPIVAIVLAGLGALAIRVVIEGRGALAEGDAAVAAKRSLDAIDAYETAARWYLPLAPHVDDAYAKLRSLTASEDPATALAAWRAIRSAAHATRGLWTPHADDLAAADAAIAKLSARDPGAGRVGEKTAAPDDEATREAWQRARLARDGRPGTATAVVGGLGILLWLVGAWVLVRRGLTRTGAWIRRPALSAGAAILVGLALWLVGLYNA
jgi:hypothetical protein